MRWAVSKGRADTVEVLVLGTTALTIAAANGDLPEVKRLLTQVPDVNTQDHYARTGLIRAAMNGSTSVIEALLESGADPNVKDDWGCTALDRAVMWQNGGVGRLLGGKPEQFEGSMRTGKVFRVEDGVSPPA